ncbi:MAG: hypothetical protein NTY09_04850 [bacterium]|nr:hypothetical protein [bacterium]
MSTDMNLVFMVNDLILKYHNNSPYITRFYNSTEGDNDDDYSLNLHYGLMGKFWIFNYEHCLIEKIVSEAGSDVTEIDPSGARHEYTESSGTYTSPNGILKGLTKTSGEFDLTDRSGTTWHFIHLGGSDPDDPKLYRLEYIKDRNDIRVYVEWEEVDANPGGTEHLKWRIARISVSNDQGSNKVSFIDFGYTNITIEIDETDHYFHFINTMTDYTEHVGISKSNEHCWIFDYDDDGHLLNVGYPSFPDCPLKYDYNASSQLELITDMNETDWSIDYSNCQRSITVDTITHTVTYDWTLSHNPLTHLTDITCQKTDEESKLWYYQHTTYALFGITGTLYRFRTPLGGTDAPYQFTWTNNQLTRLEMPEAIKNSTGAYRQYYYLPGGITGTDPVAGGGLTNNGQGNLVVSRFYDGSSWLEEYRRDYYYDSDNLLQWEGKEVVDTSSPYGQYPPLAM